MPRRQFRPSLSPVGRSWAARVSTPTRTSTDRPPVNRRRRPTVFTDTIMGPPRPSRPRRALSYPRGDTLTARTFTTGPAPKCELTASGSGPVPPGGTDLPDDPSLQPAILSMLGAVAEPEHPSSGNARLTVSLAPKPAASTGSSVPDEDRTARELIAQGIPKARVARDLGSAAVRSTIPQ